MFQGFQRVRERCECCGLAFGGEDAGDGPVAFVVLIVGFAVVVPAMLVEAGGGWPIWLHMVVWMPLAVALCLALMRPAKASLVALQYRNRRQDFDGTA
ncbi:MAG: DUF983 domain-containing protein [Pseudomonadota bacterium]